ncbi:MAG: amino acid ABC transporter permease [Candidatus Thorarchaeota archaeon]
MQESQGLFDILILIMIRGLPTTLVLTLAALIVGLFLGMGLALMRVYGSVELQWISIGYEKLLRGIPLLILFFIFGIGLSGLFAWAGSGTNALFAAAIFSLAIRSAAYQSEIFRGGIMSVDPGQMMAAQSIGLNKMQATRHVILPQAFRLSLPGWANEYAVVIKDSSLAMAIAVHEIMYQAKAFSWDYPELFFGIILVITIIYFLFTYPVTKYVAESMTKKLRQLGLGGGQ